MRVGLIGYGLAGEVFHAPLIKAADMEEIRKEVAAQEAQIAEGK